MAIVFALPNLFDAVVARFALESVLVPNAFGWRERGKRTGDPRRIVWIPGDDESGELGELDAPKQPGRNPRPLATLHELFTVYLETYDATGPENERTQYQAARELFDAWWRAVHLAAHGTVRIESSSWVNDKKERRHGAAIRVLLSIEAMIPDEEHAYAPTDARAVIDSNLLDTSEELETAPAPPAARAATTEAITLSLEQTIDGVELVDGDRVLVKDQTDGAENGVYVVAAAAWSRDVDELEHEYFIHVEEGDENGDAGFELTTEDPIVIDTTPLVFERVSP